MCSAGLVCWGRHPQRSAWSKACCRSDSGRIAAGLDLEAEIRGRGLSSVGSYLAVVAERDTSRCGLRVLAFSSVLEDEHLLAGRHGLAAEAGDVGVPEKDRSGAGFEGIDRALGDSLPHPLAII